MLLRPEGTGMGAHALSHCTPRTSRIHQHESGDIGLAALGLSAPEQHPRLDPVLPLLLLIRDALLLRATHPSVACKMAGACSIVPPESPLACMFQKWLPTKLEYPPS
jgi:hypothetical protein